MSLSRKPTYMGREALSAPICRRGKGGQEVGWVGRECKPDREWSGLLFLGRSSSHVRTWQRISARGLRARMAACGREVLSRCASIVKPVRTSR